jgi:hypothetical protein
VLLALVACASPRQHADQPAPLALPDAAAPAKELVPLSFMVGRWVCVNPNKTVNDEQWMAPRGNNMAALFRQIRRDGKPALVEVTLITVEADASVALRLRHLHADLEVPDNQKDVSLFKLVSADATRAEFAGTGAAAQVAKVIYRAEGPDTLVQEVQFAEGSGEKGYSLKYTRER